MSSISVNIIMLFLKGIPEGLLAPLALHIFTRTKINTIKYLLLSFIYIVTTYLIRLLPVTIGVNTIVTLLVLIVCFQIAYKPQLSKVVRLVVSAVVMTLLIVISELLNMLLLTAMYGQEKAKELFNSSDGWTQVFSTLPSTVFLGLLILAGYFILKSIDKRKNEHGKTGTETGE